MNTQELFAAAQNADIRYSRRADTKAKYEQAKSKSETELNYRQWVQVRTPEFKAWFGDWENDPDNASKVVNPKTGEPLVVYHGTNADFSKFDKEYQRTGQYGGEGFFFTANPETSGLFGDAIMPVFLRAKTGLLEKRRARTEGREVSVDHIRPQNDQRDIWVVFKPEQIKSAIGNSGAFSAQNADFTQ